MVNSIKPVTAVLLACASNLLPAQVAGLPSTDRRIISPERDSEPDRAIINEIVQHALIIEELLLMIKSAEQAEETMPRLHFHYDAIAQKINKAKELIDTADADIIIAQEYRRDVAQQFGRLSVYSLRIWEKGAYGSEELKHFVEQFCPKAQQQGKTKDWGSILAIKEQLPASQSSRLQSIESDLYLLYETLQLVKSLETARQYAEKIDQLIKNLEPAYGETRQMVQQVKTESERQLLDSRLENMRQIGAMCRAEMVRVREESYFVLSPLVDVINDPYEGMEKLKKAHQQ